MNQNTIIIGTPLSFIYNGKQRDGIAEKVAATYVTLKQNDGSFKSFTYEKIGK